jgi:hypothetical protein
MHPFLEDPENLRAFQQLTASPTGSVRKWEQLLGWKPGRMQRYLASLAKYGLAKVESCKQHSVFRPLSGVADCSVVSRSVAAPVKQGHCSSLTKTSLRQRPRGKAAEQPGTELLVDTMNQSMKRFGSYLPVLSDNFGSRRAAKRWLVDQGIPLEEAITLLYRAAEAFDLDLAPGHDYPESIAYFSKFVIARWKAIQRDRHQLGLFPKMDMQLERPSTEPPAAPPVPESKPEPQRPLASTALMAEVMARLAVEKDLKDDDQDYPSLKPRRL